MLVRHRYNGADRREAKCTRLSVQRGNRDPNQCNPQLKIGMSWAVMSPPAARRPPSVPRDRRAVLPIMAFELRIARCR